MSFDLKTLLGKLNVDNGTFRSSRDKEIAKDIWDRHSLQTLLESSNLVLKKATSDRKMCEKYIIVLTVLVENAPDNWISIFMDGFNDSSTQSLCINSLRTLSKIGAVQPGESTNKEEDLFDATDFLGVAERACLVLNIFRELLKRVTLCGRRNKDLDSWRCMIQLGYFLFVIAAQQATENLWTNQSSVALSKDCVCLLLETFGCPTVSEFLVLDTKHISPIDLDQHYNSVVKKSIIGKLLLQWKPHLQRNTWKQNPAVASSFSWCLKHLKFTYLSDFIELLLPPCLLFIDSHVVENKEMGTSCLIHILQTATAEELRWYGRADVIYEALKRQMYSTEESLLKQTHEAILLILKVIVKDNNDLACTTKYDEIFSLILQAAFHENKLVLRRVHTHSLHLFIECLGINVVKYMKQLLELVEEYLEISDLPSEEARVNTLNAVKSLIKTAWPRIPSHSSKMFKVLIKLIHQLTSDESGNPPLTVEIELSKHAVDCLKLLKGTDEIFINESIQLLKDLPFSEKFHTILRQLEEE